MDRDPSTPWGGDDLSLETEDEYRQRTGQRVLDLGESGPELQTIDESPQPTNKGKASNRLAPIAAAVVLAIVGWEVTATLLHRQDTTVTDASWRQAVAELDEHRKGNEPVLIAPAWAAPVGRAALGSKRIDLRMASLSDVDRFERVFELSTRGARHRWLRKLRPKQTWRHGAVTLALYEKGAAKVLTDFTDALDAGSGVEVTVGPPTRPCRRAGKRYHCGGGPHWVGKHLAEVGHQPYRCIYAHPLRGKRLRITFKGVRVGNRIVGYSGIDDFENRKRAKGSVRLQIFVDDELVGGVLHQNAWPWPRFEADTSNSAGPKRQVRLEVTSEQPAHRTFCFHVEARR